ncbi:MAG: hypothetical protein ACETWK_00840 [Candidatus Aminicenantaceae bacterium]
MSKFENTYFRAETSTFLWEDFITYLPFGLTLFSPLLLKHYLISDDLKVRLNLLVAFMVAGFICLKLVQVKQHLKKKTFLGKWIENFNSLSLRKRLIILFLLSFIAYNICTYVLVSKGITFAGDEPYYLLTTHSLYQDQDINVANNYKNQDYFNYYPRERYPGLKLPFHSHVGRKGYRYIYNINQPGVSFLILPNYWLSQLFKGNTRIFILKGSLIIWTVLLGLQLYIFFVEFWNSKKAALLIWFFYSFSVPLLFYSNHIYSEIPVALFSLYIFRKIRCKNHLSLFHYFFMGLLLSSVLFFGIKFNMIFWPLLIVSLYFLLKEHKARWKVFCFIGCAFLGLCLFYFYLYELYGSFNPLSTYEGVMTPEKTRAFIEKVLRIPAFLRIDSFFDYFFDQRDGLLLYSPFYFFAFLGLVEVFRKSKKDFFALLFITIPYLFNYAFFTTRQGYCPQGRVLTTISWIGAILVGFFVVYNRKKLYSSFFWILGLAGFVIAFILLQHPDFLSQPTTREFTFRGGALFVFLSNLQFYLPNILPSFVKVNNLGYIPNYVWFGLIFLFIIGYFLKKERAPRTTFSYRIVYISIFLLVFFVWFCMYPRVVLLFPVKSTYPKGEKIAFYSLDRFARMEEPGKFYLTRENSHSYVFHFTSWRKIREMRIKFGSLAGNYKVDLRLFDKVLFRGNTSSEVRQMNYTLPPSYRYKRINLYRITLYLEEASDISTAKNPYVFSLQPSY